jgi:glutathione S-transferase
MKIYTFEAAPNPQRLKLFLQYKGVSIDSETVDLRLQEQFSDAFKSINPELTVPVLVLDDGSILTEVISICWYLESLYPERPLLGRNALEQAEVLAWDHSIYNEGFAAVAETLRNSSKAFKGKALPGPLSIEQIPALIERGQVRLAAFFDKLDAHIKDRKYLVGDDITFADIDAYVVCSFAAWVKITIPDHCKHLQKWHKQVAQQLGEG